MSESDLVSLISVVLGIAFSMVVSYFPYVAERFYAQPKDIRSLITLVGCVIIGVGMFLGSCYGFIPVLVACSKEGALLLAKCFALALVANKVTYEALPKSIYKKD